MRISTFPIRKVKSIDFYSPKFDFPSEHPSIRYIRLTRARCKVLYDKKRSACIGSKAKQMREHLANALKELTLVLEDEHSFHGSNVREGQVALLRLQSLAEG
jgi:hypothetical protein